MKGLSLRDFAGFLDERATFTLPRQRRDRQLCLADFFRAPVRAEFGFAPEDPADVIDLFDVKYRGCRYSFGYPACPDLEERARVGGLLRPERIGVSLSEQMQLHPEQSTDALIVHHPEAKYFNA